MLQATHCQAWWMSWTSVQGIMYTADYWGIILICQGFKSKVVYTGQLSYVDAQAQGAKESLCTYFAEGLILGWARWPVQEHKEQSILHVTLSKPFKSWSLLLLPVVLGSCSFYFIFFHCSCCLIVETLSCQRSLKTKINENCVGQVTAYEDKKARRSFVVFILLESVSAA